MIAQTRLQADAIFQKTRKTQEKAQNQNNEWWNRGSPRSHAAWDETTAWLGNSGEMIYRLFLCTSGFRNCKWGILFLQNCVGVKECEWGRSHHLYYFPEFSISPSWAPLVELSVYIQDIGNPISHNWDIFILYRHFTQLKHTHANGKVLQRYEQSFIAHTLNSKA